jgi:two-component system response regulator FixJ
MLKDLTMSDNQTVYLIDDDEDVRRAVSFLLSTAGFAVRVYESAVKFLEKVDGLPQGCIVSDVRMPALDGVELLRRLKDRGIAMPVIIMTGHGDVALAVSAMKAGAVDFIEKPFGDDVLISAVQKAQAHLRAAGQSSGEITQIRSRAGTLSDRERQVLDGLLRGLPNKTIAYDLSLSPRTVEVHRAAVMAKMGAKSLSELVRMAMLAALLPDGSRAP